MSESVTWPVPVIILAGGYGTRVRHLLPDIPKPMAPMLGRPFVEWVVRFYAAHGCRDFILSTGYLAGAIAAYFDQNPIAALHVKCVPEHLPQGTAGGCAQAASRLGSSSSVLVVNGDSLVLSDPQPLATALACDTSAELAMMGLAMADTSRFGSLIIDDTGRLLAFSEKQSGAGTINAGVYLFRRSTLATLPPQRPLSLEVDVFPRLAAAGHVFVARTEAPFLDIGTPETLQQAERFIKTHQHHFL